jgi:hypothetical protein
VLVFARAISSRYREIFPKPIGGDKARDARIDWFWRLRRDRTALGAGRRRMSDGRMRACDDGPDVSAAVSFGDPLPFHAMFFVMGPDAFARAWRRPIVPTDPFATSTSSLIAWSARRRST